MAVLHVHQLLPVPFHFILGVLLFGMESNFPGAGDVWFSLRNTTYHNNSNVTLEDIGEGGDGALLCRTKLTACCRKPYSVSKGNWFFPNGTKVPSSGELWNFHRTRSKLGVHLNCRRGGVNGIYRCVVPDSMNVTQTIYIGVYSATTCEWLVCDNVWTFQLCSTLLQWFLLPQLPPPPSTWSTSVTP